MVTGSRIWCMGCEDFIPSDQHPGCCTEQRDKKTSTLWSSLHVTALRGKALAPCHNKPQAPGEKQVVENSEDFPHAHSVLATATAHQYWADGEALGIDSFSPKE